MSRGRSQTGAQSFAARETGASRRTDYIDPSPLTEVLHEQLDYLVAHAAQSCAPGCEDCVRLQQVQGWLLIPFRGARRVRTSSRAA
jgi:hypothetical protein